MNTVQPIKSKTLVLEIIQHLKETNVRDYIMFMFGVNSSLRISDILLVKVGDVKSKNHLSLREKKTGKENQILLNKDLQKALETYIKGREDWNYLFESRQKTGRKNKTKESKPISRQRAYQIMQGIATSFGLDAVGTHTMRKTFGYHFYQDTKDIATLQKIFNHSSPTITLRYIGIDQDHKDRLMGGFSFYK